MVDVLSRLSRKDILGKKSEPQKAVMSIIDLRTKNVVNKNEADSDGFKPFVTTAALNINSLSKEAGLSIDDKLDFVTKLVNQTRKRQMHKKAAPFVLDKDNPHEDKREGDTQISTWSVGLKGLYRQKKGKGREIERREPKTAIQITRRQSLEGETKVGEPVYQLERVIERH